MNIESIQENAKAFRSARDTVIRGVGVHLASLGFDKAGSGSYAKVVNSTVQRIGFQKLSSGKHVRLITSVEREAGKEMGPVSDTFGMRKTDGSRPYNFSYHLSEESILRCIGEFNRYISHVVLPWFESLEAGQIDRAT